MRTSGCLERCAKVNHDCGFALTHERLNTKGEELIPRPCMRQCRLFNELELVDCCNVERSLPGCVEHFVLLEELPECGLGTSLADLVFDFKMHLLM